jgi:hypothetical protein
VTTERSYELPSEAVSGMLSGMLSGLEGIPKAPSADGADGGASFPRAQGTKASCTDANRVRAVGAVISST